MLVPVGSLRRDGDLGIGDTAALRELVDWAGRCGLGFLQLLPINETGSDHSPYNAISSVALEPALIDLTALPELGADVIAAARDRATSTSGRTSADLIDYDLVKSVKRELLEIAFQRFWEKDRDSARGAAFEAFRDAEVGWLEDYCRFRWLMDREGRRETWDLWSINYNKPQKARDWIGTKRGQNPRAVDRELAYHAWVQWIAFTQWRELRQYAEDQDVLLMGDVPIGISYHSTDVFFEPEWFDLAWSGGAPPERVFKDDAFAIKWGQNWGIPLYRWDVLEADDFRWWRRRIDKLTDVFHIFRIDHILGFYRIYGFPWRPQRNAEFLPLTADEARARTGGPLPGFMPRPDDTEENKMANLADGDKYLRVVLEAAGENEVVGEDLGAVPDYVRPHLRKIGIAGFKVCHWEVEEGPDGVEHPLPPEQYEECSFTTYATHDHPSMAAMWEEFRELLDSGDPDERRGAEWNLRILSEIAGLPVEKDGRSYPPYDRRIQWAQLEALLASGSRYAAFMITDLYRMTERFNIPGTVGGSNWRIRMPFTVNDMSRKEELAKEGGELATVIRKTNR
jgi:4-alpha-glucanotransferase